MTESPTSSPNAQQIAFWNGEEGAKWASSNERLDQMLERIGQHIVARAAPRPGEAVIDVGCGGGATLAMLAHHVGREGHVTGIDISAPLLAIAQARAKLATASAEVVQADAETHPLPERRYDLAFSRFGVMFFANPANAFVNLRRALKPGGRLAFVCWRAMAINPWMMVPRGVVTRYVAPPLRPADPTAPGPFAFADPMRIRGILAEAGFGAFQIESFDTEVVAGGGTLEGAVVATTRDGPLAGLVSQLDADQRRKLEEDLRDAYRPFVQADGRIQLPAACWVVTGRVTG